jgi:acyl carrier protein
VHNLVVSIEQEVAEIVSRITKAPIEKIGPDTHLKNELNVDSLQGLQILAVIEKRFGVSVPDDELDSHTSIREIVRTVENSRASGRS